MKNYSPPRLCLLLAIFLFSSLKIFAQTKALTGVVKDSANQPLPGATVSLKGSKVTVQTTTDGSFTIPVPPG